MYDGKNIKGLIVSLTFIDIIIFTVFVLFLSSGKRMNTVKYVGAYQAIGAFATQADGESDTGNIAGQSVASNDYQSDDEDLTSFRLSKYQTEIVGYYTISNMYFHFYKEGGRYDGFFDNSRQEILNGSYELKMVDGEPVVYIYDPAKSLCVSYYLSINNSNNVVLFHKASNTYFELKE